jgi:3-oxoacyl-[acyl-carrier-protein] synthase-3
MMSSLPIGILGTGAYLPEKILTNADLEKLVETSDQWIRERTGIRERRVAGPDEDVATMGVAAARQALENAGLDWGELRYIIAGSNTSNYMYPAIAIRIQHGLGLDDKLAAFDLQAGCSGFNYALYVAESLLKNNGGYALVIGTDTNTRMLDFSDRSTCILFGDGAGAVVVGPTDRSRLLASFVASSYNGKLYLKTEFSELNSPFLPKPTPVNNYMYMDGPEIFKFAVRAVQESLRRILAQANMTREDIDFLIIHQANYRILETGARFAKMPMDKVYVNVDRYGNTSAASIPIALHEALMEGKIKKNHKVILISFGAGVTWAATALEWLS